MAGIKEGFAPVNRNTRIRAALIRAALDLLAEGEFNFSVAAITKAAEVVPQTLYNHFETKEALLTEAKAAAMAEFEKYMFEREKDVEDPLEKFVLNLRLFGRAPDTHPHFAAIITNSPLWVLMGKTGYSPVFGVHGNELKKAGLIKVEDLEIALIATASSLEHIVVLRANNPSIPEKRVDDFVYQCLLIFGITPSKAKKLVNLPLPIWR